MRRYGTILATISGILLAPVWGVDLFVREDGLAVENQTDWEQRREELKEIVVERFYGRLPPKPTSQDVRIETLSSREIMDGRAHESLSVMIIRRGNQSMTVRFGVVRPMSDEPVPLVIKNDRWIFDLSAMPLGRKRDQYANEKRPEEFLKIRELTIERGYAICKFVREDLAIDGTSSHESGILAMYPEYSWGAIAAWAWGYQPLLDYLLSTGHFREHQVIATGHSRGGKAALAAAILDKRIAIAAPSASGSGGTGSWFHFTPGGRQQTPQEIFKNHGFWFGKNFQLFVEQPGFDGYVLHALVAPRGLINTQGIDDGLANPMGTRLMFETSQPVFELLESRTMPATHWRPGGHGHLLADWRAIFNYADAYANGEALPDGFNQWPPSSTYEDRGKK